MKDGAAGGEAGKLAADTANAVLKAGAAVARTFAESISGRPQPIVPDETPLAALLRHASVGVAGAARIVIDAARSETGQPGEAPSAAPPAGPRVRPGGTLRIPLSVDNPGESDMHGLTPALVGATCDGAAVEAPSVTFSPTTLSIAPRDFEKLVLAIDVPPDAPEGLWRLSFSLSGDAATPTEITFRVAAPD